MDLVAADTRITASSVTLGWRTKLAERFSEYGFTVYDETWLKAAKRLISNKFTFAKVQPCMRFQQTQGFMQAMLLLIVEHGWLDAVYAMDLQHMLVLGQKLPSAPLQVTYTYQSATMDLLATEAKIHANTVTFECRTWLAEGFSE